FKARLQDLKPNPIRDSIRLTARGLGKKQLLDLRLRHPRPIYYDPPEGKLEQETTFLMTSAAAWNESQPYPTRDPTPRFEEPKPGDRDRGTVREKRRGQFPIAVAVETKLPASWYRDSKSATPAPVRLAVIGHGGVFMGPTLSPVREKLLLDVSNWLLGRDD